ncbi:DNA-binding LacI/PurR family transcriptional regulator [Symbiobacterium terraclitae]|uniref:DNA-binding LacI/PurR family transcriptional regulator n=1 Tax=Symbiobacterium terraclitae TaxID=557451 RepID=A0ABS4JSP4_9FIRM|nr:LacI family DNA-binding transcriptional regulator [Symbiobacterium terraclitae]MBP2018557.1 DNA-binding LacI/PurR family transcriptional regulator [Symbiobacterium terraclitae]
MANIKDVARLAGVSPSTVSRVVAGSSRISPETQARVREAMKVLNYYPNANARSLVRRATNAVGVIIARPAEQAFANPFFPEVLRGIGAELHRHGYDLVLTMTTTPEEEHAACLRLLKQRRVDGVILTSSRVHDALLEELVAGEYPFVLIGRAGEGQPVSWVNNDNVAVGEMAVEHLVGRGHQRIALINGPEELTVSLDRRQGFRQAMARYKLDLPSEYEVEGEFTKDGGYRAMVRLLTLPQPPTAVFCADDAMAVGALMVLKERGLTRQVALIGVNDDPLTALLDPPLSTVRIPVFDLGSTAARLLLDGLQHGVTGPRQVVLPSQLVVRESTNWTL